MAFSTMMQSLSRPTFYHLRTLRFGAFSRLPLTRNIMNRPRNRQPRPGRQNQPGSSGPHRSPATPQQAAGTVPTLRQVVEGASVYIVLKEDQPTGRETFGVVQDILTNGNHPRGIKVRLRGGQVGRVQRMQYSTASSAEANTPVPNPSSSSRFSHRYTDVRLDDDFPSEPPPRSLADFMPVMVEDKRAPSARASDDPPASQPSVQCPFCDAFEGDEAAVTYHIEKMHLT